MPQSVYRGLAVELGLDGYWGDIEFAYARFMKMTGERPGTVREIPNFSKSSKASRATEDAPDHA